MAEITAVVATTHPVAKYHGRFRATRADLEEMADEIRAGTMGQTLHHDPTEPLPVTYSNVFVEQMDDGEWRLVVQYEVSDELWHEYETARVAAAAPGGMSYATTVPFDVVGDGEAAMLVAGEADAFTQDEIRQAAASIGVDGAVVAAEYVEFAAADACNVIIVVHENSSELHTWGSAIVGGLIAPALLALWRAGKRITYRVRLKRDQTSYMDCVVKTDDREVLARAVQQAGQLEEHWESDETQLVVFDQDRWQLPN